MQEDTEAAQNRTKMDPLELLEDSIFDIDSTQFTNDSKEKIDPNESSINPDPKSASTSLEEDLLSEILDLEPLMSRDECPAKEATSIADNKENHTNTSTTPTKQKISKKNKKKLNPFYSPSQRIKQLVKCQRTASRPLAERSVNRRGTDLSNVS